MLNLAPSSVESVATPDLELGPSGLLRTICIGFHVAVALVLGWNGWPNLATVQSAVTMTAVVGCCAYSLIHYLQPGLGVMPTRVRIDATGCWHLQGRSPSRGYTRRSWVLPWLCCVDLSLVDGGTRRLWLARDAVSHTAHWRLRRWLRAFEESQL